MSEQTPILRENRLRLKTLSSLHIGTGEQLREKEYGQQGKQIFVANPKKLLALMQRSPALESAFISFCEDERQDLTDFLEKQRIPLPEIADYRITATGQVSRLIPKFIKTAERKPYIPGSSLKGAIRSALLRSQLLSDIAMNNAAGEAAREDLNVISGQKNRNLSRWRKKIGTDVERTFFGRDEHHDLMRCLQFGDSNSCENNKLRIAEIRVLSIDQNDNLQLARDLRRYDRDMRPLTPEVLPKGIVFTCPLTLNFYLMQGTAAVSRLDFGNRVEFIKAWLAACNHSAQDLIHQEIDFFTRHPFNRKYQIKQWYETLRAQWEQAEKAGNQCLLHMAWGSGWDAKTVTDLFDKDLFNDVRKMLSLNVGRPHVVREGRLIWGDTLLEKSDSPKSRKIVFENGHPKEPLGWVRLSLEEVTD